MRNTGDEEPKSIGGNLLTLDVQDFEKTNKAPVLFLSQDSALIRLHVVVIEAQSQDSYCQNVQKLKGIKST